MIDKDNIQDLLREKLQSHEVTPSDAVWKNVSSSLSNVAASSAAATGTSVFLKVAAALVGVSGLSIATYFILQEDNNEVIPTDTLSVQVETETSTIEESENIELTSIEESIPVIENKKKTVLSNSEIIDTEVLSQIDLLVEASNDLEPLESEPISTIEISTETEETAVDTNTPVAVEPIVNSTVEAVSIPEISEDIVINEEESLSEAEEEIELPNIFTPNNDGVNDYFEIIMSEKLDFQIVVIDQTNAVIFQSNSTVFKWDGTLPSGEAAPSGNYVYFLSAKTMSGRDFVKSSGLRIQR